MRHVNDSIIEKMQLDKGEKLTHMGGS